MTSSVTPVAGGVFKYETEVTNLTNDVIEFDWAPGPLGCASEVCGNDTQEGSEQCDGSDLDGASCEVFGGSGTLGCTEGCVYDLSGCNNVCGNGELDTKGEQCDGSDLGGETCVSQGYGGGTLACDSECGFDTEGCFPAVCGNDVIEGFESCDGSNLGGNDCVSQGYSGGTLACTEGCAFDESGCVPFECGNDVREGSEQCDGSDLAGETCGTQGFECGFLSCAENCSFDTSDCDNFCLGTSASPLTSRSGQGSSSTLTARAGAIARTSPIRGTTTAAPATSRGTTRGSVITTLRAPGAPARGLPPAPGSSTVSLALTNPGGEAPCDFEGFANRVDGGASRKICRISAHPAKEVTSQIVVCGDGLPSGPQGCGTSSDSGSQGTANVLVPDLETDIDDVFLSPVHVAVRDGLNGFAEPGETFDLFVALLNSGPADLTNVTATLSAVAQDMDGDGTPELPIITQATSPYPTIPGMAAGVADCDSPAAALQPVYNTNAFVVTLPAGFPIDSNFKFVLTVSGVPSGACSGACLGTFVQGVPFVLGVGSECSLTNLDGSYTRVDGFLSPMGALVPKGDPFPEDFDASSNKTRPLKLRLFCGDKNLNNEDIAAPQIVSLTRDGVPIDVNKVDLNDNANSDSLSFRFASGFWIYNMRTKLLGHGTFVITIRFANGQEYQSQFVL